MYDMRMLCHCTHLRLLSSFLGRPTTLLRRTRNGGSGISILRIGDVLLLETLHQALYGTGRVPGAWVEVLVVDLVELLVHEEKVDDSELEICQPILGSDNMLGIF